MTDDLLWAEASADDAEVKEECCDAGRPSGFVTRIDVSVAGALSVLLLWAAFVKTGIAVDGGDENGNSQSETLRKLEAMERRLAPECSSGRCMWKMKAMTGERSDGRRGAVGGVEVVEEEAGGSFVDAG
jgi:hypothetical protein